MNNETYKYFHPQLLLKFLIVVTTIGAAAGCVVSFYDIDAFNKLVLSYYEIIVFASLGTLFCNGLYFSEKRYFFYLLFLVWILLSFFLRGEFNLIYNSNSIFFILRCAYCGILLPFSKITSDIRKRKFLGIIFFIVALLMCVMLWLAFLALIKGENIKLFSNRLVFGASYTRTERMKLKILNLHYYYTGIFSVAMFFCTLYLAVSHWKGILKLLWTFMLSTFFAGVFITYSRTAVVSLVAGCLLFVYCLICRKISSKKLQVLTGVSVTGVAVTVAAVAMNKIYSAVNSIRNIWYGITTLSSRTIIWASILKLAKVSLSRLEFSRISALPSNAPPAGSFKRSKGGNRYSGFSTAGTSAAAISLATSSAEISASFAVTFSFLVSTTGAGVSSATGTSNS